MSEYEIRKINLENDRIRKEANDLIYEVFQISIEDRKLILNTFTKNRKSLYLAAYLNGELAAINFFIAHTMMLGGENIIAHQSCWSATSKNHRKKGLFSKLINHAKEELAKMGSAFIFGFPNMNSESIFINRLGFRLVRMNKVNLIAKPLPDFLFKGQFKSVSSKFNLDVANQLIPLEAELIDLKSSEYGEEVKFFGAYNNLVWGKVVERKWKLGSLRFFLVGGIQVNKPHLLSSLFSTITKEISPNFIQIVGTHDHLIWTLIKGAKHASKTEPLIVFDLNQETTDKKFSFINGIKDVF